MATQKIGALQSQTSLMTTELNSLADGARAITASAYNNSSNLWPFGKLEYDFASFSPVAGGYIAIYALESADGGSTYPTGDASTEPSESNLVAIINVASGSSVTRRDTKDIPISSGYSHFILENQTGAALAASANTLKIAEFAYTVA